MSASESQPKSSREFPVRPSDPRAGRARRHVAGRGRAQAHRFLRASLAGVGVDVALGGVVVQRRTVRARAVVRCNVGAVAARVAADTVGSAGIDDHEQGEKGEGDAHGLAPRLLNHPQLPALAFHAVVEDARHPGVSLQSLVLGGVGVPVVRAEHRSHGRWSRSIAKPGRARPGHRVALRPVSSELLSRLVRVVPRVLRCWWRSGGARRREQCHGQDQADATHGSSLWGGLRLASAGHVRRRSGAWQQRCRQLWR